jgi:hypothetical protein
MDRMENSVCFLLNGIILLVYTLADPTYVRPVHGLIVADVVLTLGFIAPAIHAFAYVAGNILFIIGVLISELIMLGVFYKRVGYLSIVNGLVGSVTNVPNLLRPIIRDRGEVAACALCDEVLRERVVMLGDLVTQYSHKP